MVNRSIIWIESMAFRSNGLKKSGFFKYKELHAPMNFPERVLKADVEEPLMAEWVLAIIEARRQTDAQAVEQIEQKFFSPENVSHLSDIFDETLLSHMFRTLSPECFAGAAGFLIQNWPAWKDSIARWSAPLIARYDPAAAEELFQTYCRQGERIFIDLNKMLGLLQALTVLPFDTAANVAATLIDAYFEASLDSELKGAYFLYIAATAWTYHHPGFPDAFKAYVASPARGDHYGGQMALLPAVFNFTTAEYDVICRMIEGDIEGFDEHVTLFYDAAIAPVEFRAAINLVKKRSFDALPAFFEKHASVIQEERVRRFFKDILDDRAFLSRLHRKKQRPYFYAMMVSCMMASLKKEAPDLSGMPIEEAARLAALDVKSLPNIGPFLDYFRAQPEQQTVSCLCEALENAMVHPGCTHLIEIMASLGYDGFVDPLVRVASDERVMEESHRIAESALAAYGKKAIDYFTDHFEELSNTGKESALKIVQHIGGPKGEIFIDRHFDTYWKICRDELLDACVAAGGPLCRKRLEAKAGKGQIWVDRAYLILSLLDGDRSEQTERLLRQFHERRKEQQENLAAFSRGDVLETVKPYIDVELLCKNCGDVNTYRLQRIFFSDKGKGGRPYIAQEIRCINCNRISEFEFTRDGHLAVTAGLTRIILLKTKEDREEALKRSPVKIVSSTLFGKSMDIQDAIALCEAGIEQQPDNPDNYIHLGTIYNVTGQLKKAAEYCRKAIDIAPAYLQPYYNLSQAALETGNPEDALNQLEKAKKYLSSPKFTRGFENRTAEFVGAFCGLYNSLSESTKRRHDPLRPSDFKLPLRVGRNDPCPCGSGKKYKKCCLLETF